MKLDLIIHVVMKRNGTVSWPPARKLSDDMEDDMTDLHTTLYHMSCLPKPSVTLSIAYPDSDRCDTNGVSVSPSKRSVSVIRRFNPVLGWRTILHLLASRTSESIFHTLWNRVEDDLLVQVASKYSTPNVLGHDWIEVVSELPIQCQQSYMFVHTVSELTFVFLSVTFRGSPF